MAGDDPPIELAQDSNNNNAIIIFPVLLIFDDMI